MITKLLLSVLVTMALGLGGIGCDKSKSGEADPSGGSGGSGAKTSGVEREAQDAAVAEAGRHWVKGADGWTTARDSGTSFAPVRYLRQMREIGVEGVEAYPLSESDKLNGFEWAGEVRFKHAPCREAGEPGVVLDGVANVTVMRQPGRWSQWIDISPEAIRMQKVKGKWQAQADTWMLRGTVPTAGDFAKAGVR